MEYNCSERQIVPGCKKLQTTIWHRMLHSCTHMATVIQGLAPGYLGPFTRVARRRPTQSPVGTNHLVVPTTRLSTVGSRAFPIAGPQTWNDLPEDLTSAESLTTFCRLLKTRLFRKFFPDYLLDINWLSPVDLAVVPLLRPPKNWLIDWLNSERQRVNLSPGLIHWYVDCCTPVWVVSNIVARVVGRRSTKQLKRWLTWTPSCAPAPSASFSAWRHAHWPRPWPRSRSTVTNSSLRNSRQTDGSTDPISFTFTRADSARVGYGEGGRVDADHRSKTRLYLHV